MKKISLGLTRGAVWVAAGLIVGAGIGTGVGFLVVGLNKTSTIKPSAPIIGGSSAINDNVEIKITEKDSGVPGRESVFGNLNEMSGLKDASGKDISVVQLGWDTLAYKIRTRLGVGPEIAQLKGITITSDGDWAEANGVYLGGTDEIFINSKNIINEINSTKNTFVGGFATKQQEIEFVAEFVYQIIAHEYNHHMAYTYINSRFKNPTTGTKFFKDNPVYVDAKSVDDKGKIEVERQEAWDRDFYQVFTSTLNYDNLSSNGIPNQPLSAAQTQKDNYYKNNMLNGNFVNKTTHKEYTPISKYFTPSDIFKFANFEGVNDIGDGTWDPTLNYAFFNGPHDQPATSFTKTDLLYQYSLAELYARKVQQFNMPLQLDYTGIKDDDGNVVLPYPLPEFRQVDMASDTISTNPAEDPHQPEYKLYGVDQLIWGLNSKNENVGVWSPFILDTKNYTSAMATPVDFGGSFKWVVTNPFTSDYLYKSSGVSNGIDNSNAYNIYDAILNEMGYAGQGSNSHIYAYNAANSDFEPSSTEQADISTIWWKNDSTTNADGRMEMPPKTDLFNMGGYTNDKYTQIGYLDDKNNFVKLSDIKTSTFTYGVKESLIASSKNTTINSGRDTYFWTLDGYKNINDFVGKNLMFYSPDQINSAVEFALPILQQQVDDWNNDLANASNQITIEDMKTKYIQYLNVSLMPKLNSYNTDATTWLSNDSAEGNPSDPWPNKTGINSQLARPTYSVDRQNWGVRLELLK